MPDYPFRYALTPVLESPAIFVYFRTPVASLDADDET